MLAQSRNATRPPRQRGTFPANSPKTSPKSSGCPTSKKPTSSTFSPATPPSGAGPAPIVQHRRLLGSTPSTPTTRPVRRAPSEPRSKAPTTKSTDPPPRRRNRWIRDAPSHPRRAGTCTHRRIAEDVTTRNNRRTTHPGRKKWNPVGRLAAASPRKAKIRSWPCSLGVITSPRIRTVRAKPPT